jgi:Ser/Thr protein kinase RdoA (MazF antagonist)
MDRQIIERYSDSIFEQAKRRYDVADDRIRQLGGFESFIYEFERGARDYILRIGHSLRRTEAQIQGEVDWINYLARGGVSVSGAVRSVGGNLVESIADAHDGRFLVTAFAKAQGRPPWEVGWTRELYEIYGQLLGRMHALAKAYKPADGNWLRPHWDDPVMDYVEETLPASEALAREKYRTLVAYLQTLPRDDESYGLIHYDAHGANLYVDDNGTITLFDFDDCAYGWFILDIAMVLFYIVMGEQDERGFTREFMNHFLRGYRRENQLDAMWLKEIPYFLKLREIDLYGAIHGSFDVNNLDEPWNIRYMQDRKYRIENDVPYLDFDFESLAGLL